MSKRISSQLLSSSSLTRSPLKLQGEEHEGCTCRAEDQRSTLHRFQRLRVAVLPRNWHRQHHARRGRQTCGIVQEDGRLSSPIDLRKTRRREDNARYDENTRVLMLAR